MNWKTIGILTSVFVLLAIPTWVVLSKALYKPKVFDCFLFCNEFDVLDIRLNELNDKVDKFILVECTKDHQNKKKPLYFLENKEKYSKFSDKIVHVVVDDFPEFGPINDLAYWEVENFQRNQIMEGLKRCHPNKRDIVMITDVDEIIRNDKVGTIVKLIDKRGTDVVFGEFDFYAFFVNRKQPNMWCISIATSWETLSKYIRTPQAMRDLSGFTKGHATNGFEVLEAVKKQHFHKKWAFTRVRNVGWHFTSLGNFKKFLQKLERYPHLDANSECNRNLEKIRNDIAKLEWCEITDQFPQYVVAHQEALELQGLIDQKETTFQ
jgi:beta-1,4-mannosyl-glycoprotein beta-1,4-N-acetylglucosaminyltransferase